MQHRVISAQMWKPIMFPPLGDLLHKHKKSMDKEKLLIQTFSRKAIYYNPS